MWNLLIASTLMLSVNNFEGELFSQNRETDSQVVFEDVSDENELLSEDNSVSLEENETVTNIDNENNSENVITDSEDNVNNEDINSEEIEKENVETSQNTKMTFSEWIKFLLITSLCIVLIVFWVKRKIAKLKQPKSAED